MNITKISSEISVLINEVVAVVAKKLTDLAERIGKAVQSLFAPKEVQMKSMIPMEVEEIIDLTEKGVLKVFKEKVYPKKKGEIEAQIKSLEQEKQRREFYRDYLKENFDPTRAISREGALQTLEESLVDNNRPMSLKEKHERMEKGFSKGVLSIQTEIRQLWQECIDYSPTINKVPIELDKFTYAELNIQPVIIEAMDKARKAVNVVDEQIGHLKGELTMTTNAATQWDDERALNYVRVAQLY